MKLLSSASQKSRAKEIESLIKLIIQETTSKQGRRFDIDIDELIDKLIVTRHHRLFQVAFLLLGRIYRAQNRLQKLRGIVAILDRYYKGLEAGFSKNILLLFEQEASASRNYLLTLNAQCGSAALSQDDVKDMLF